jgi:AbrB family looped-hinge helix DNA binding protein
MPTVTVKGQVTIPKAVRDLLGIKPGNTVSFELNHDGRVVINKAGSRADGRRRPSRFERLRGSAGAGMTTDEIMKLMRGDD